MENTLNGENVLQLRMSRFIIEQHKKCFRSSLPTIDTVGLIKPKNISCYFPLKKWPRMIALYTVHQVNNIIAPTYIYVQYVH